MMTLLTVFIGALLAQIVGRAAFEFGSMWLINRRFKGTAAGIAQMPDVDFMKRLRERHQAQLELQLAALNIGDATGDGDAHEVVDLVAAATKFTSLAEPTERTHIERELQRMAENPYLSPVTAGCAPGSHAS